MLVRGPCKCIVHVHPPETSPHELLLNPELLPDAQPGDLLEISAVDESGRAGAGALIVQVSEESLAHAGARELAHGAAVSVVKALADLFGLKARSSVVVTRVGRTDEAELAYVELLVKEQYISRSEIWQLQRGLLSQCVYAGKLLVHGGLRLQVQRLTMPTGAPCLCGLIAAQTKLVFRSRSQHFVLLLQLAAESAQFADDGERYAEKAVDFVGRLLAEWTRRGVTHALTLVLCARTRTRAGAGVGGGVQPAEPMDVYKVVCARRTLVDWAVLLRALKAEVSRFLTCKQWCDGALPDAAQPAAAAGGVDGPSGGGSGGGGALELESASRGNLIEAINLALDALEEPHLNRELSKTGQQIVLVSPSPGLFECSQELLAVTSARMEASGIGCDLVCLGRPPRHTVPLIITHPDAQAAAAAGGAPVRGGEWSGPASPPLSAHSPASGGSNGGAGTGGGVGGVGLEWSSPDWLNTMFTDPPAPGPAASRAVCAALEPPPASAAAVIVLGGPGLSACAPLLVAVAAVWSQLAAAGAGTAAARADADVRARACAGGASATCAAAAAAAAARTAGRLCALPLAHGAGPAPREGVREGVREGLREGREAKEGREVAEAQHWEVRKAREEREVREGALLAAQAQGGKGGCPPLLSLDAGCGALGGGLGGRGGSASPPPARHLAGQRCADGRHDAGRHDGRYSADGRYAAAGGGLYASLSQAALSRSSFDLHAGAMAGSARPPPSAVAELGGELGAWRTSQSNSQGRAAVGSGIGMPRPFGGGRGAESMGAGIAEGNPLCNPPMGSLRSVGSVGSSDGVGGRGGGGAGAPPTGHFGGGQYRSLGRAQRLSAASPDRLSVDRIGMIDSPSGGVGACGPVGSLLLPGGASPRSPPLVPLGYGGCARGSYADLRADLASLASVGQSSGVGRPFSLLPLQQPFASPSSSSLALADAGATPGAGVGGAGFGATPRHANPFERHPAPAARLNPAHGARAVTARQWLHVVNSTLYRPSERMWMSLCEPALLPLATNEVPPTELDRDREYDMGTYTIAPETGGGAEVGKLLSELICQRLEQDFQLIAQPERSQAEPRQGAPQLAQQTTPPSPVGGGRADVVASSGLGPYYVCYGHSFQLLSVVDGVLIEVKIWRRKARTELPPLAYSYLLCGAEHSSYERQSALFRARAQRSVPFNWNHLDFMVAGGMWSGHALADWMEYRVVTFCLLDRDAAQPPHVEGEGAAEAPPPPAARQGSAPTAAPAASPEQPAPPTPTASAAEAEGAQPFAHSASLRDPPALAISAEAFRRFAAAVAPRLVKAADVLVLGEVPPAAGPAAPPSAAPGTPGGGGSGGSGGGRGARVREPPLLIVERLRTEGAGGRALTTVAEMDAQLLATRGWHVALKWRVSVGVSVDELVSFLRRKARQCGLRLVQVPAASTRASNGRAIGGPFSPPFVVPCAPPLVALALRALCAAGGGFDFALEREGAGGRCAPGTRYVQRAGVALVEVTEAGFVWVSNTLHALSVDEAGKVRSSLELLADFRARVALEHQRSLAQESRRENADAGSVTVA